VTFVGGLLVRLTDPASIPSLWTGFWWSLQTVTTVGYGDVVPTQGGARVIAAMLMLSGIGFVTVVTAVITAAFLETIRRRLGDPGHAEVLAKLEELNARLQSLESGLRR